METSILRSKNIRFTDDDEYRRIPRILRLSIQGQSKTQTSYILDGWKDSIVKIGISHQISISIALYLTIYYVTPIFWIFRNHSKWYSYRL